MSDFDTTLCSFYYVFCLCVVCHGL